MTQFLRKTPIAARFLFWFCAFLLIGFLSFAFGLIGEAATWAAGILCDVADFAVVRGQKLRERMR